LTEQRDLFGWLRETSASAAAAVVPLVIRIAHPRSVLDVGCGNGVWLTTFAMHAIDDVLGIDVAPPEMVDLPADRYRQVDLDGDFALDRRFDLAVCLEVGEHLQPGSAERLVTNLVRAAPVVVFSAAIPGQGGIGHVNEQWPDWWRALFESHGYRQHDLLRASLWDDARVSFWYAQNTFVYAEPTWSAHSSPTSSFPERVVHPGLLAQARRPASARGQLLALSRAVRDAVRRRLP
jgi:SAM-dependent methyltransferase